MVLPLLGRKSTRHLNDLMGHPDHSMVHHPSDHSQVIVAKASIAPSGVCSSLRQHIYALVYLLFQQEHVVSLQTQSVTPRNREGLEKTQTTQPPACIAEVEKLFGVSEKFEASTG